MFARFDENPAMTLQDIQETKRYGRTQGRTDNVKTVYSPQTKFAGGIIITRIKFSVPYNRSRLRPSAEIKVRLEIIITCIEISVSDNMSRVRPSAEIKVRFDTIITCIISLYPIIGRRSDRLLK